MFISPDDPDPMCKGLGDMFYGTDDDGRAEAERDLREAEARSLCHVCIYRWRCLEWAIVHREKSGVWGAMGEGERIRFRNHLYREGYTDKDTPHGDELIAAAKAFYREEDRLYALMRLESA